MKSLRYLNGITILFLLTSGIFAAAPNWDCDGDGVLDNYNDYANNGSITAAIYNDAENMGSIGDMFASFVGDELRGVAQATSVPPQLGGGYAFLMLAYSNEASGETLNFKFSTF